MSATFIQSPICEQYLKTNERPRCAGGLPICQIHPADRLDSTDCELPAASTLGPAFYDCRREMVSMIAPLISLLLLPLGALEPSRGARPARWRQILIAAETANERRRLVSAPTSLRGGRALCRLVWDIRAEYQRDATPSQSHRPPGRDVVGRPASPIEIPLKWPRRAPGPNL